MTCQNCGHHFLWDKGAVRLDVAGINSRGLCCRFGWNTLARAVGTWNVVESKVQNWWTPRMYRDYLPFCETLVAHRAAFVVIAFALFIMGGWVVQWAWDSVWLCVMGGLQVVVRFLGDLVDVNGLFVLRVTCMADINSTDGSCGA